ncbi:filamentous hemagglutinin N-terminal domain-containing protein, partial [Thauera aminoaromatica]
MVTQLRQAPLSASTRAGFRTGLRPLVAALLLALGSPAFALPTDPTVVAGQAVVRGAGGNSLVIDQASAKAAIDWRSFNIGAGEAVRFNQPSAAAMTVNRVTANNPSEILGLISAPGTVFLVNPAGIIFGRSAVVDVGSLVASTLTASTSDLLTGRAVFNAAPGGSGAVRNEGSIVAAPGGSVSLIGTQVSNTGSIATPGGTTGLIAGERVSVDFEGDGLVRYQVDASAARALVEQSGQISADGGRVALQAGARDVLVDTVLNVDGVVRARGISQRGGEIYLDGGTRGSVLVSGTLDASGTAPDTAGGQLRVLGENVGLVGSARLDASGDAGGGSVLVGGNYQGGGPEHNATRAFVGSGVTIDADALARGNGGRVITWADDWTRFYGTVSARGGAAGGDGGFVEVSGKQNLAFAGS